MTLQKVLVNGQILILYLYSSLSINGVWAGVVINDGGVGLVGERCPGTVEDLVCVGVDLAFLQWRYTATGGDNEEIVTYTTIDEVDEITFLSGVPTAFISAEFVSLSVSPINSQIANFTSILTVNTSLLTLQNISEIRCGIPGNFAVELVNITIIEESPPKAPVITDISATYHDSILDTVGISWEKASVLCVEFESSLSYEVTLSDSVGGSVTTNQVSQDDCTDDCFTMFDLPERNSSLNYQIIVSAANSIGNVSSETTLERQSSSYLNLSVSFMDCITSVQCSPLVGSSCSVQYTAASDGASGTVESNSTLLEPNTAYIFTATSTVLASSYTLRVIEKMSFTTGSFSPRLSTSNIAQVSVGVILAVLSLVFLCVTIVFMLKLCGTLVSASQPWKISLTLCSIVITLLWLLCFALWIAVACIVGVQNDTCDLDWQQTRDAITAAALAVSCLTFVAGSIVMIVTCYYYHKSHKTFLLEVERKRKEAEDSAPKESWREWLTSKLPSWPLPRFWSWSRSNGEQPPHEYNHLDHGGNKPQRADVHSGSQYEQVNPPRKTSAKQQDVELEKMNDKQSKKSTKHNEEASKRKKAEPSSSTKKKQSRGDETDGTNQSPSGCAVQ